MSDDVKKALLDFLKLLIVVGVAATIAGRACQILMDFIEGGFGL